MRLRTAVLICAALLVVPLAAAARVQIRESGSTLLYPVMNAWVGAYAKVAPDVDIATEATGSGAGIAAAADGSAQLGTSDAYLSGAAENGDLVQIPLAISGQFIAYNLGHIRTLKLDAGTLAGIYAGKIATWNDKRIGALNPGTTLPATAIIPLRRSDRSGDTFLFTSYLAAAAPNAWTIAPATSVSWPSVPGEQSARGNRELLDLLHNAPGGIAYVGISLYDQAQTLGVGIASLRNRDGAYVLPTSATIAAALARVTGVPRDARISLIDLPGAHTYPIANVEYAVVKKQQRDASLVAPLRDFLSWVVRPNGGNAPEMLDPVHFVALPEALRAWSLKAISALR